MGDTLTSFTDLSASPIDPSLADQYFGLTDTGLGFSGSSTVTPAITGSPLPLDTSTLSPYDASVTDLLPQVPASTSSFSLAEQSQMLAGNSDVPPSLPGAAASTNTPNVAPVGQLPAAALSGLSKFGSALAGLFGGAPRQILPNRPTGLQAGYAGGSLAPTAAYNSGAFTGVTVIIVVVLIVLLLRNE